MKMTTNGMQLRESILDEYDLAPGEVYILDRLCRVADIIAALERDIDANGEIDDAGDPRKSVIELRQQSILASRLVAALRLPDGIPGINEKVPQRRGAPRGAYVPRVLDGGA